MEFRLLGPVELWTEGGTVDIGPRRQRCVLTALAVDAGMPVRPETVIERVWGQVLDDRVGQGHTWDSLGYVHHQLGDHQQATRCFRRALDLYREAGHHHGETDTLIRLGDLLRSTGDADGARDAWQQALATLDALGEPEADDIRAKLRELPDSFK
jgi:tetratricopeptide (TPR) repeat protein